MKVLLLEDNDRLARLIKEVLDKEGCKVDIVNDGDKALNILTDGYRCYIIDINVPSIDGLSILKTIRMYHKNIPVIIISSNHELQKIQQAYELGCDDYLKKPFYMYELSHKVKKLIMPKKYTVDLWENFYYDINDQRLYQNGKGDIKLARKEILFLELFIKNKTRTVNYEQMQEYIWEGEDTSMENIRALIKRLRKKLPQGAIESIKHIGYRLGNLA